MKKGGKRGIVEFWGFEQWKERVFELFKNMCFRSHEAIVVQNKSISKEWTMWWQSLQKSRINREEEKKIEQFLWKKAFYSSIYVECM